jgi:O-antigen/teichoic acid export membrane protein
MTNNLKQKDNGLLSNAVWNIISLVIAAAAGFITMPIIINGIGISNFGLYGIIMMIGGFVALQDMGLGEATLRFVSKYYGRNDLEGVNRVLGATLSVYLVSGTLVCILAIIFAPNIISLFEMEADLVSDAVYSLRIASVGFVFLTIGATFQKVPEAMLRYDISSKVGIVLTSTRLVLVIVIIKLGYGIIGLVWLLTLNSMAMVLVYMLISRRLIKGLHCLPNFKRSGIKEVFSYGLFSFANQLIGSMSNYVDRFILGIYFGVAEVGFLTAPKDLLTQASGLTGAAGQALFPRFSSMHDNKQGIAQLYVDSTWMLLCFSLLLFLPIFVLLPEFLALWISPEFSQNSSAVAQLFALNFSLLGVTVPYFSYLKGSGKIHWLTLIFFVFSGLSIIVGVILIKLYGLEGAGIRAISMSWSAIVITTVVLKKGINPPHFIFDIVRSIALPIIISAAFTCANFYLWNMLDFHGWLSLFLGFPIMVGLLATILAGVDLLLYKEKGVALLLINKVNDFRFKKR